MWYIHVQRKKKLIEYWLPDIIQTAGLTSWIYSSNYHITMFFFCFCFFKAFPPNLDKCLVQSTTSQSLTWKKPWYLWRTRILNFDIMEWNFLFSTLIFFFQNRYISWIMLLNSCPQASVRTNNIWDSISKKVFLFLSLHMISLSLCVSAVIL